MSTLRVTLKQTFHEQQLRNIYYVSGAYAIHDNGQEIVDFFRDAYEDGSPDLVAQQSTDWQLDEADIKDVTDPDNPTIPYSFTSGALVGELPGDTLPTQICFLLQFKAQTATPNLSRKYLGGFTEGAHSADGWGATHKSAVENFADYILDMPTILDTGIQLSAVRLTRPGEVYVGANLITLYNYSDYARVQRRRTPGRGI